MRKPAILVILLAVAAPLCARDTVKTVHTKAPEWTVSDWIDSKPLTLQGLRGKVVLVRWWTAPYCPFCIASAPALNEWHKAYGKKGLVVIGFYHHKAATPFTRDTVAAYAKVKGFKFPVATDQGWVTLRRWWLEKYRDVRFTSVSFLVDKEGLVRYIHPGGQYVKGDDDYASMQAKIEALLSETPKRKAF